MGKIRKINDSGEESWEECEEIDMCECGCMQQIRKGEVMLALNVGFAEPLECDHRSFGMVLSYTHMCKYRFDHRDKINLDKAVEELFAAIIKDPNFHRHIQIQHEIDGSKKNTCICECGCRRRIRAGHQMIELVVGKAECIEGYDDNGNVAIVDLLPDTAYFRKYLAVHSQRIDLNNIRGFEDVTVYGKTR